MLESPTFVPFIFEHEGVEFLVVATEGYHILPHKHTELQQFSLAFSNCKTDFLKIQCKVCCKFGAIS